MTLQPNWPYLRTILPATTLSSDSQTYPVKLPLSNYLHTLYVTCKMTNGATSARNLDMSDVVDEVKVVANGSEIIYSLTPAEIKRWCLWMTGKNLIEVRNERASAVQSVVFPIYFGRGDVDPDYYLPCARFTDLELKVTYSPEIDAAKFATGTFSIAVHGQYSMGQPLGEYRGSLVTKGVKNFTTAASGDEQTLLPRGNLLRQLMVYCYEAGIEDGVDVSNVKLDLNNGERVLFDIAWNDLNNINTQNNWVFHEEHIFAFASNDDTIISDVARILNTQVMHQTTSDATGDEYFDARVDGIAGDTLTLDVKELDITAGAETITAYTTDANILVYVRGLGLSHAVVLDLAKNGESQILNTSEADQVQLTLTQGGADGACRISAQEVRSF